MTKDLDGCIDKVPRCTTETPWLEETPCCATACVLAYQEERRLGAPLWMQTPLFSGQPMSASPASRHSTVPPAAPLVVSPGGRHDRTFHT